MLVYNGTFNDDDHYQTQTNADSADLTPVS